MFQLNALIQGDLEEYYDEKNHVLRDEGRSELVRDVVRMIRFDVSFEKRLLEDTLDELKNKYNISLWQNHVGKLPTVITEEAFDAETANLRENFSHERVAWLKQAGQKLYGSKTATTAATTKPKVEVKPQAGELQAGRQQTRDRQTHSQQTNNRQTTRTSQTSNSDNNSSANVDSGLTEEKPVAKIINGIEVGAGVIIQGIEYVRDVAIKGVEVVDEKIIPKAKEMYENMKEKDTTTYKRR